MATQNIRMDALEKKVDGLQSHLTRVEDKLDRLSSVEGKLDKLIHSLVGDELMDGAIGSINKKIADSEQDINNLAGAVTKLTQSALTPEEHKSIRDIISFFKGWKLVFGLILWLIPLATFIFERLIP